MPEPGSPSYATFETRGRKSTVFSTKGMICSSQPLASSIGLSILNLGGNAADAAIAVASALNVTEPCNCGIGGDVFALYYDARTKEVTSVNGSGRSPGALSLDKARELGIGGKRIPKWDVNAVTVPGACAAWVDIHERLGSGKIALAEVLEPAAKLAEEGFPVHPTAAYEWSLATALLRTASPSSPTTFLIDNEAPKAGEIFINPDLAETIRAVGRGGKRAFYGGRIGTAVVDVIASLGGVMTLQDLASHETVFEDSITYTHTSNGLTVHECPPNGQGLAALIAMGIIDVLQEDGVIDLNACEAGSAAWYHALIEAMRLAFADVHAHVADPAHMRIKPEDMLTKAYLRERARAFSPTESAPEHIHGYPSDSSDTVYFTTSDSEGNAMSMIMSNYLGFGSGIVPKGCGFSLQNRGGGFVLQPGHPNSLEGGKKPFHTIIPAMITKRDGELFMAYGTMGGAFQPQGHLQVLMNLVYGRQHPQQSLDFPRFCIGGGHATNDYDASVEREFFNGVIEIEDGVDPAVIEELRALGHELSLVKGYERVVFGKGQIIMRTTDERTGKIVWAGGSDPRGDGIVMPQF